MLISYSGVFFLLLTFIVVAYSFKPQWFPYDYNRAVHRENQIAVRGVFVLLIIVSHMFRNVEEYADKFSVSVLHFFFPSIVCIFFFYSGYGLMYNFTKGKRKTFVNQVVGYVKKIAVPALIVYLLCAIIAFFSKEKIPAIASIGGWFAQVLFLLYMSYTAFSHLIESPLNLLYLEAIFVGILTVIVKVCSMGSFVFIDLPAFLFGMVVNLEEKRFQKLLNNKWFFILNIGLTFTGGAYLAMLRYGFAPTGFGIGLVLGFINSISEVVVVQILLTHLCFKDNNLLKILGKYSYEIYLAAAFAKPVTLMICKNRIQYYTLYLSLCILGGVLVSKFCNYLFQKDSETMYTEIRG